MEDVPYTAPDGTEKRVKARVIQVVKHKTEGGGAAFVTIVDPRTSK